MRRMYRILGIEGGWAQFQKLRSGMSITRYPLYEDFRLCVVKKLLCKYGIRTSVSAKSV